MGPPGSTSGQKVACDLVVNACVQMPSTNLLAQAGARLAFDEAVQAFLPVGDAGTDARGRAPWRGRGRPEAAVAQGRLAGLEVAAALGHEVDGTSVEGLRERCGAEPGIRVVLPPEVSAASGKQFACLCMDVTSKELKTAVAEGFDSMELLKRYTTITMGPCQGKACMLSSQRLCGRGDGTLVRGDGTDHRAAALGPRGDGHARPAPG